MKRFALAVAWLGILGHAGEDARAASVGASVTQTRLDCPFAGAPDCRDGVAFQDDLLAPHFHNVADATPGALAVAEKSYVDPRLGTTNSTSGNAIAGLGVLRVQSAATVSSAPPLATGTVNLMRLTTISTARFADTITIVPASPALLGMTGIMTASIAIGGSLQTSAVNTRSSAPPFEPILGYADWRLQIQVGSTFLGSTSSARAGFFGAEGVDHDGPVTFTGSLGEGATITFSAPIVFGVPTDIQVAFATTATALVSSTAVVPLTDGNTLASAESLYMSTAAWNGIDSVTSFSAPVEFSVTSASGLDYALPVPEPRAAVLLAAGLLLLAGRRCRGCRPSMSARSRASCGSM